MTSLLLQVPVAPVPASRPRVTRWGTYYGKNYTQFRKEAEEVMDDLAPGEPLDGSLEVVVRFFCRKPKTTRRAEPGGDVDNYVKAILDSCNGKIWKDDDQILRLTATKRWEDEHGPRIELCVFAA